MKERERERERESPWLGLKPGVESGGHHEVWGFKVSLRYFYLTSIWYLVFGIVGVPDY